MTVNALGAESLMGLLVTVFTYVVTSPCWGKPNVSYGTPLGEDSDNLGSPRPHPRAPFPFASVPLCLFSESKS